MLTRIADYFWPKTSLDAPYVYLNNIFDDTNEMPLDQSTAKLINAARVGDLDTVKTCIECNKLPVDSIAVIRRTTSGNIEYIYDSYTALFFAIHAQQWAVARYLIQKGADLHFRESKVQYFQVDGIKPRNSNALTPLHILGNAAMSSDEAMALFKDAVEHHHANLNVTDPQRNTVAHYAIKRNCWSLFNYCLAQNSVDLENAPRGDDKFPSWGNSLLTETAKFNRYYMALALLNRGVDVDGGSKIHHKTPPIFYAANQVEGLPLLQRLVEQGANVNLYSDDCNRRTALHEAIKAGHAENVHFLLEHGADMYLKDCTGSTPLDELHQMDCKASIPLVRIVSQHVATNPPSNKKAMLSEPVKLLAARLNSSHAALSAKLGQYIDPTLALFAAAREGDVAKIRQLVEEKGFPVDAVCSSPSYSYFYEVTALAMALMHGQIAAALVLIKNGANINYSGGHRNRQMSIYYGNYNVLDINVEPQTILQMFASHRNDIGKGKVAEVIRYAVQHAHADVTRKDRLGNSLLHYAIWKLDEPLVHFCLEQGLSLLDANKNGRTPLDEFNRVAGFNKKYPNEPCRYGYKGDIFPSAELIALVEKLSGSSQQADNNYQPVSIEDDALNKRRLTK